MGNILHNSLDVTYEDFLRGVFGVKSKPERTALKSLFSEIVTGKSTLVSDLSSRFARMRRRRNASASRSESPGGSGTTTSSRRRTDGY